MKIVVINKKHVITICIILIIGISMAYVGQIKADSIDAIITNSTPITNKNIILDAGHGFPDQGTTSKNGVGESKINLEITLKLQKILEQSGAKVILTRSDENGIYTLDAKSIREKKLSDIGKRVEIGNNSNADIYVSIHLNFYRDPKYSGWQTFYQSQNEESKRLANIIQEEMNKNFNKVNNRVPMQIKNVYVMDNVKVPAVIIECGFLSNGEEEGKLKTDSYQSDLAWGIYTGIQKYFFDKSAS